MAAPRAATRPLLRAAAGFALAGAAYVGFVALFIVPFGVSIFAVAILVAGLGMLAAAAGLARGGGHIGGLAATGFATAAAGAALGAVADIGGSGLYLVGHAVIALGLVEAAWYALRAASEAASLDAGLSGLAIASKVCAAGIGVYFVLLLLDGFYEGLPLEVVALAGFLLADRAFGEGRRALLASLKPAARADS
jgi:hypothetical protein